MAAAARKPGRATMPVVLVLDNGPIHTSKASTAALAAPPWITVEWLPRYAPELNAIEATWRDLKRHYLAHRTFRGTADLDRAIHQAVADLNQERAPAHPSRNLPDAVGEVGSKRDDSGVAWISRRRPCHVAPSAAATPARARRHCPYRPRRVPARQPVCALA